MSTTVPRAGPLSAGELVAVLAPTLGQERSREAIVRAARELGIDGDGFGWSEGIAILDRLAKGVGLLALAARIARDRMAAQGPSPEREAEASPEVALCEAAPGSGPRVSVARLVSQLAPALGQEKSEQLVGDALRALGFGGGELSLEQALSTLDQLGTTPGIIGVTARFARARLPRALGRAG